MTEIIPATYAECVHVARRLRELDRVEIMPMLFKRTPEELALHAVAMRRAWCVQAESGEPVAIMGWHETRPTVADVFMYATDRWAEIARSATVFAAREIKADLADSRINRAQCWALQRHASARAWLTWLGFRMFGIASDMGPERETYVGYCFTRSMLEAELVQARQREKGAHHATGRPEKFDGRIRWSGERPDAA